MSTFAISRHSQLSIMRFCYLRLALLTSVCVANALADTVETDVDPAASRTASSHDTASGVIETREPMSVDDEDRASAMMKFAKMMGKTMESDVIKGLDVRQLKPFMMENMTLKDIYLRLGLGNLTGNVLSHDQWIRWAYFVYKLGRNFHEYEYDFIVATMSAIHDAETLSSILITAANAKDTEALAIELAKVADDHIRRRVLDKVPRLARHLLYKNQYRAKTIHQTRRDHILGFLTKHAKENMLQDDKYLTLTSYLSVLRDKNNAVGIAQPGSHIIFEDAILLDKLLSLGNFRDPKRLDSLVSIWLDVDTPPSRIVSMLVQDTVIADHFAILFSNGPKQRFWLRYLGKYNEIEQDTLTASVNFEQLLEMLLAVVEQESSATDKEMAFTIILKMLVSPSATHFSSKHQLEIKLVSILLLHKTLPSGVLSMLMHGAADTDKFNIIFVNEPSKSFWVRYLKKFNGSNVNGEDSTRIANTDFQKLLVVLDAVEEQKSSKADQRLASSTVLKMLILPEITNVVTAQNYLKELTSIWLKKRLSPSTVVFLLLLEEKEADYFKILLTNTPSSKYLEDYTNAYYADAPKNKNYKMATLVDVFGDAKLKKILLAGVTDKGNT